MLTGMPPYYAKDREKLFNSIKTEQVKFTPKLKSETDTRYIDPEFTSCPAMDSYHAGESLNDNENPFVGFSYDANKEGEKQPENQI